MSYNGWSNYETWCFNAWHSSEPFNDFIKDMLLNYERSENEILTDEERHIITLMHHLKDWTDELREYEQVDTGNGFFNDMLGSALELINWYELAENYYEGYMDECNRS